MPYGRPYRLRRQTPTEAEVLSGAKRLLDLHPRVAMWWRNNTGAGYVLSPATYRRLVASGALRPGEARWVRWGTPGAPDILGALEGGRLLAIEVKRPGERPGPEQEAWLDRASRAGALAGWVDSVDALARMLEGER